jgi:hypothetical protein
MDITKSSDRAPVVSTGTYRFASDPTDSADLLWRVFAGKIAGRPRYRSLNAAGDYHPRNERVLSDTSPARPAAVMIYSEIGTASTICLDFDAKHASMVQDLEDCQSWLDSLDVLYVVDRSVSGGHHVYVPLAEALDCQLARFLVEQLGTWWDSLDPSPHRVAKHGCIRVPGSRHKNGGYQELVTDFDHAATIFEIRNSAEVVALLLEAALPLQVDSHSDISPSVGPAPAAPEVPTASSYGTSPKYHRTKSLARAIADGASYEGLYSSPSEARMAAMCSLVASGWTDEQIYTGLINGQLPGLAALYQKYQNQGSRQTRIDAEISKARNFAEKQGYPLRKGPVRKSHINDTINSRGGDTHGEIRRMRALLDLFDLRLAKQRSGIYLRFLLRALFEFSHKTGKTRVAVGCRALAVAMGVDHSTVARRLKDLAALPDSPVTKVKSGHGLEADEYELSLAPADALVANDRRLAAGKIYSIRPVFRALGPVAALAYESIEKTPHQSRQAIARTTGLSGTAVYDALRTMAELGMIELVHGEWRIVKSANLRLLADMMGVFDEISAQISLYRAQRQTWHKTLASRPTSSLYIAPLTEHEIYDHEMNEYWVPPDDYPDRSLVDIALMTPYARIGQTQGLAA